MINAKELFNISTKVRKIFDVSAETEFVMNNIAE